MKETGILIGKQKREKPKTVHTPENIDAMAKSVYEASSTLIHLRSQQSNISETSLKKMLHKFLGMTPYNVQLVQELKTIDHLMRFRFAKWACDRLIFSNEDHFDLGGYVNKQNYRIWGTENPHAYI